jgi:hypothetical protein
MAALQYATVAILQGHELVAMSMAVFAFFFDAAIVASAALVLVLARRALRRRSVPS